MEIKTGTEIQNERNHSLGSIQQLTQSQAQSNIDPYYQQRPNYQYGYSYTPTKPQIVIDFEKVAELFASGVIDKEMTLRILGKRLDEFGPKKGKE